MLHLFIVMAHDEAQASLVLYISVNVSVLSVQNI